MDTPYLLAPSAHPARHSLALPARASVHRAADAVQVSYCAGQVTGVRMVQVPLPDGVSDTCACPEVTVQVSEESLQS